MMLEGIVISVFANAAGLYCAPLHPMLPRDACIDED
jgi:hypothetical protein